MERKSVPKYLPEVKDRIWLVQKAFEDCGYIDNAEIVTTHEFMAKEAEADGWRVTEYRKVES